MKELYIEGLANHNDHESCAGSRKITGEALTVAHAGEAIEPRNALTWSADALMASGRQHCMRRNARCIRAPRGRRSRPDREPKHAWKLFAREPGEPLVDLGNEVRVGNPKE